MKISQYILEWTSNDRIRFRHIWAEFVEWLVEMLHWNRVGMREEWGDVLHFIQLWLFWRFGLDGELWPSTSESTDKFMGRLKIWRQLYVAVGLPEDSSRFCGNCTKLEKVIKQLGRFGISRAAAEQAYERIVLGKS
ncbi:MAG: hypothetical protein ABIJ46_03910 [bacterium]